MGRLVLAMVGGLALSALALGGCVALVAGAEGTPTTSGTAASVPGATAVPGTWEALDRAAAATCPGLDWGVLAAIGRVESDSGRSDAPGVSSGSNQAGAEGPMQFEPATFAVYATVGPGGATPPSPYDPVDAVYSTAHLLCANGGANSASTYAAVYDYNHAASYVEVVLVLARALDVDPSLTTAPATALAFAAGQLGKPYLWGGTGQGGWDCSGLVQAAYRAAGLFLPRVAQAQFAAGPAKMPGTPPHPGDLLFFGGSDADVTHVGIYVGDGLMIDAPHTGTVVRVQSVPTVVDAPYGTEILVGITRPS